MLFSPEMVRAIRSGKKTSHRLPVQGKRPWKRSAYRIEVAETEDRPRHTVGHITLIGKPREEVLETITLKEARREGFRTSEEFWRAWEPHRGKRVWVLTFEFGDTRDISRFPAARSEYGYTSSAKMRLNGTGEEVPSTIQARYAENGRASHADVLSEQRRRALDAIQEIGRHHPTGLARKRLRTAEYQIKALDFERTI